jgi:hypothetical protein
MEEGHINNDTIEIYLSETYWQAKYFMIYFKYSKG